MKTRAMVAAILILSPVALVGCGSQDDAVVQPLVGPSGEPAPPTFSKGTNAKIKERTGAIVEPRDANAERPLITLARAMEVAGKDYFYILQGKPANEVQYGLVTNSRSGALQAGGSIKPALDRKPMWLLYYSDVEMAVSSPETRTNGPLMNHSDFLVYIDATTGESPRAESV